MEVDRDNVPDDPAEKKGISEQPTRRKARSTRRSGIRTVLLIALVSLLLLVVAVIWILPGYVDPVTRLEGDDAGARQVDATPPSESETRRARYKREAEKALQQYLRRQAVMEAREVSIWGGPEYDNALQAVAEADASFAIESFEQAKTRYEAATRLLEALEESTPERLQQALTEGEIALERFDADAARRQFQIALALDSGNEQARAGAARAGNIEQLSRLLDRAREAEANNDLASAHDLLEQAVALDPLVSGARSELDRVGAEIEARHFKKLMSEALGAMENGRFDAAGRALSAAEAIHGGAPGVADARGRLKLAIQQQKISEHRTRAEKFAQAERWHESWRELDAVLAIDPQAQFAVQGLAQSRRLAKLHDQLNAWLQDPDRLRSPQPRANARTLLDAGVSNLDKGPRLQQKFDQLADLVALAETPVPVALVSDGLTDVTINRIGRFGKFEQKTVPLLPGKYVVLGSRTGYRDVRFELNVRLGSATPSLVVKCGERV